MSEGHQVIAQDTVTDTIGHSSVKGQDDINFTFTLYSGEDQCGDPQQLPERTPPKTEAP